ncbi:polyhydroxyalkanoate synthesis repressor PhaR [Novosphingobium umbonatum]|uniref:Polyhydroxyalkanoate synthesis repressor PhaR n=1 Tax=Novosphingobium umbonatum TaxID=1908524 RepID=A0A3S2VUM9_9SPHN|nr:polyhydroxyalkanoate synthesis repressor PhaR [Novosphingobium umbonatum]RVU06245.1 polyhydroxyalkanoate synthesis repressor PhaR [Novosphingobium umbonatum]
MTTQSEQKSETVIIKKYANRRLYNTQSSSYITLDHLAKMTREGIEFRVLDAKTGTDITHQILTQIIMEEEASGEQMLPVNFLRQLIGMYGNSMQGLIPHYLEASMDQFRANQLKLRKAFEESIESNPLAKLAQQNIAMFQAAAAAFIPGAEAGGETAAAEPAKEKPAEGGTREELDALRSQMAEMQKMLDKLAK